MIVRPLNPAVYAGEIEQVARADNWTLRHLSPCAAGARPWLHRAGPDSSSPRLYLSAGIHGDEVAGPIAVLKMLRLPNFFYDFDTTIFPILNPDGIARGLRGNADGIDLNRDYKDTKSHEIRSHKEAIDTVPPFDAAMYLHEDFEGTGAYVYELNDSSLSPTLGFDIIQAISRHVPIDLRPEIEDVIATGGVLSRRDIVLRHGPIENRPEWPEAIYLGVRHTKVSYTTETPMLQPLEHRVAAQIAAVSTLMNALRKKDPSS
jgi:protein MpaA